MLSKRFSEKFSAWEHGQDLMLPSKESTSLYIFEPCLLHAGGRDRSPPVAARSVDLSKTIAGGALSPDQAPPPSSSPGPFGSASMTPLAFGAPTPGLSPQTPAAGPFGRPTTAPLSFGAPTPSSAPSTPAAPSQLPSSSTLPGLFTSHPSVSGSGVSTPGPFGQLAVAQSPVFGLSTIAAAPVASNGGSGPFGAKAGEPIFVTAALTVQACNVQHLADIFCFKTCSPRLGG